jgi:glycerol uptake facilitator-like aquaporin
MLRAVLAEGIGSMLLATAVIGSGIMAQRLTGDVAAQLLGGCLGAELAHAMFDLPLLQAGTHARAGLSQFLSEMVATSGLIAVVSACATPNQAAWRVPAWIGAAYWFTASTSFANPAITIARALSDTFAGIRAVDVPGFIAAQLLGALVGFALARWLFSSMTLERGEAKVAPE